MVIPKQDLKVLHALAIALIVPLVASPLISASAQAAEPESAPKASQQTSEAEKQGAGEAEDSPFLIKLRLGASASFTQSSGVVGQQDGLGVTFGTSLSGQFDWIKGTHEWRTGAAYAVAFSYTSVIGELVKTHDRLHIDSSYTWKGLDWLGPFVRVTLESPFFAGYDVRAEPVDYEITYLDGRVESESQRKSLRLTSPLEPLQLSQSIGVSFTPLDTSDLRLTFNAGLTASQVFAEHALSISDKKETALVEVSEIDSYEALGQTSRLEGVGRLAKELLSYRVHGELFIPFIDSSPKTRDFSLDRRLNVSVGAKLSLQIASWVSLDYELRALLQPQIQEEWQLQNVVMLTFGYDLVE